MNRFTAARKPILKTKMSTEAGAVLQDRLSQRRRNIESDSKDDDAVRIHCSSETATIPEAPPLGASLEAYLALPSQAEIQAYARAQGIPLRMPRPDAPLPPLNE